MNVFDDTDGVLLLHGDSTTLAEHIEPESVDLIVTSPPYFALRSYQDNGEHYEGQIGDEATPEEFLQALWKVSAQCWKVLKPTGSMFVNLGDKYAGSGGNNNSNIGGQHRGPSTYTKTTDTRTKSLMGLPWRYALGMIDDNGHAGGQWILRSEIIWSKKNGLPESVKDRVARRHEQWFHFTKSENYFAALDEIRDRHMNNGRETGALGKLPGSVWELATQPLSVPEWLGVDHYAAFPMSFPYRIIKGWTTTGFCVECSQPRTPVTVKDTSQSKVRTATDGNTPENNWGGDRKIATNPMFRIVEYRCDCETTDAPTTPATVLDPFGGTGTVAAVAKELGRKAIHIDLSADYLRLAQWRIHESGHAQKWMTRNSPQDVQQNQPTLFDMQQGTQ